MNNSNSLRIRRVVAILLMALTIVLLFWPSFLSLKAENVRTGLNEEYGQTFWDYQNTLTLALRHAQAKTGKMPVWSWSVYAYTAAFFALIALAAVSVALMLLKQTKLAVVAHTVLSFVTVIAVAVYLILSLAGPSGRVVVYHVIPGPAMFLLPLFSLAASILYKRDKSRPDASAAYAAESAVTEP